MNSYIKKLVQRYFYYYQKPENDFKTSQIRNKYKSVNKACQQNKQIPAELTGSGWFRNPQEMFFLLSEAGKITLN